MLRPLAIALFSILFAGCYDPERVESATSSSQTQVSGGADDPSCDDNCQVCVAYCEVELACGPESTPEDCAWNCIGWLELATDACSAAYRDAATCIGELDCAGYDDPTTCVPELEEFHAECDDEAAAEEDDALPLMSRA